MVEQLYVKYHQELVCWCLKMTENSGLAEDLVHEAFLRAMLHEELLLVLDDKQRRAWLYRTAKNLYVDWVRHKSHEETVEMIPESTTAPQEMEELEWQTLLEALPDMEGVLFAMRYLQGYNSSQLSEIFSLPSGTIRFKLSSARKHLREMIGGKMDV